MRKILFALVLLVPFFAVQAQTQNRLTEQEKKEGWKLLFDGKSLSNWHTYGGKGTGPAWQIQDEAILLYVPNRAGNNTPGGGNIVTNEIYKGDFELKLDWKITPYTNSGIFLFVTESPEYKEMYTTGLELQVTDNKIYEGADPNNNKRAGDLFGVASTDITAVKPVSEWNQVHMIHQNGTLKIYMNNKLIHNINLNSPEWKKALAASALKDKPLGKGIYEGRIGLQDWGSQVWYRNIKIRPL